MYLLIDTNCWVDLLRNSVEEENLYQLQHWLKAGKVILILPEILLREWEKQKQVQLKDIKSQNTRAFENVDNVTKEHLKANYERIKVKAGVIDKIFANGVHIKPSRDVHADVSIRFSEKMAPFHKKSNSHSDAYLYLSTIEYLKGQENRNLVFVSRNSEDFGNPLNPKGLLHPDLQFQDVPVRYYTQIGLAISELQKEFGKSYTNVSGHDIDYVPEYFLSDNVDKLQLIDQLNTSLSTYHEELPFIPTHLLVKIFPLKSNNERYPYTYHSSFQINSNNEELFNFFNSLKITDKGVIEFIAPEYTLHVNNSVDKTLSILQKLNQNLIYKVSAIGNHQEVNIKLKDENLCNCIRCSYNELNFLRAYSLLNSNPQQDDHECLKQAYIHFLFGYFQIALKLFYHLYQKSKGEGKEILPLICLYNLKRVNEYISAYLSQVDEESEDIITKVNKISLRRLAHSASHKAPFVAEVVNWISGDLFFSNAHQNISDILEKIRDHFHTQLRGGFSSNSNFDQLVSYFAELDQFLDRNFILYNVSHLETVIDKFCEGLLMIYSFNKQQSQRINYINEYLLLKIVTYSKRESIIKYYKRIHLHSVSYSDSSENSSYFDHIALRFLSDYNALKMLSSSGEKLDFVFWERYYKVFGNIMVVLTLSPKTDNTNEVTKQLLQLLRDETFILKVDTNCIADFFRDKGQYISDEQFSEFILICINTAKFHKSEIFSAIKLQVVQHHKDLYIENYQLFQLIKQTFLEKCPECNSFHHGEVLVHVYPILNESFKVEIRDSIIEILRNDFQADLYYIYSIWGIIDYQIFYNRFFDFVQLPSKPEKFNRHPFQRGEAFLHNLNKLVNLAFMNNLPVTRIEFSKFMGATPYYDWLLDIENFDYSNFNPLWILEYQTDYYFKRIFASKKVHVCLLRFLRREKHPFLNELFIRYARVF